MALHATVRWPGLRDCLSASYTCSHGASPGVITVEAPAQSAAALAAEGDLVFGDGVNPSLVFRGCRLVSAQANPLSGRMTLHFYDRRWRWRFGGISGYYNQQDPYPDPRPPGDFLAVPGQNPFLPGTERTPRELLELCAAALGETALAFGAVPNDARPPIDWSGVRPSDAMQSVADQVGCRLIFQPVRDGVAVAPPAPPSAVVVLPDAPIVEESQSVEAATPPSAITVLGGAILLGDYWRLEYVGLEADGRVVPIDQLSYRPPRGWWPYVPGYGHWMDCVKGDSENVEQSQALAKQFVWRTFRLAGRLRDAGRPNRGNPFVLPLPQFERIGHPRQVTLLPDLYTPEKDARGQLFSSPGKLYANSYNYSKSKQFRGENRPHPQELEQPFSIDARGLITSALPIYRVYSWQNVADRPAAQLVLNAAYQSAFMQYQGGRGRGTPLQPPIREDFQVASGWVHGPAAVYLYTSARVRHPTQWHEIRGEWSLSLAGGTAPAEVLPRAELVPVYLVQRATFQGMRRVAVADNEAELAAAAGYYLTAAAAKYQVKPALTRTYAGLVAVDPDAAVEQVTWSFGVGRPPTTTVSVGTEHDAYQSPYQERRRSEAVAAFLTRDWVKQTLGIYQEKGNP